MAQRRETDAVIAALVVIAALGALAGAFLAGPEPGMSAARWYIGFAVLAAIGVAVARSGTPRAARLVVGLTLLGTAAAILHWTIVERVFSGFTILFAVLYAVAVVLSIRRLRQAQREARSDHPVGAGSSR